jgi:hypothetical protein
MPEKCVVCGKTENLLKICAWSMWWGNMYFKLEETICRNCHEWSRKIRTVVDAWLLSF